MELLGFEPDEPVTHDRLRRAYLRRLKACSPERDPEGFQRLREAFEAVEPYARMHDAMAAFHDRAVEAPAPSAPTAAHIDSAEPSLETHDAAHDQPRDDLLEKLLDQAAYAPDDEADDEANAADLEPAAAAGASASPSLREVTHQILALVENNRVDAAIDLRDRWNRSAVDDHRAVSSPVALRWALTRELLEIAVALPAALRTALAKAIAADKPSSAHSDVNIYQAIHPERSRDLARHMAKRAPNLYKVFGPGLQRGSLHSDVRQQQPSSGRSLAWSIWILIAVGSALVRAGSCSESSPRDTYRSSPSQIQLDPATVERLRTRLRETAPVEPPPPAPPEPR
jgi:hypothetical protein